MLGSSAPLFREVASKALLCSMCVLGCIDQRSEVSPAFKAVGFILPLLLSCSVLEKL